MNNGFSYFFSGLAGGRVIERSDMIDITERQIRCGIKKFANEVLLLKE